MATLAGNAINTSYQGLLKTTDNAAVGATAKVITDGSGNAINLEIGTGDINFTGGNVDFTGATVSGLPSAAGLVNGTGSESLKQSDTLTPTYPAVASAARAVAIGALSKAEGVNSIVIGGTTDSGNPQRHTGLRGIRIGEGQVSRAQNSVVIGPFCNDGSASNSNSVAIGTSNTSFSDNDFMMGENINSFGSKNVNLGYRGNTFGAESVGIGSTTYGAVKAGAYGIAIGSGAGVSADTITGSISIGYTAQCSAANSVTIGYGSQATAAGAVALGDGVTAATADYTTTQNLQLTNYASLDFADDSAAATGGVPLGGIYHTSGALKIRIA